MQKDEKRALATLENYAGSIIFEYLVLAIDL